MSATITITDDHPKFSAIVALLAGTSAAAIVGAGTGNPAPAPQPMPMPTTQPVSGDDDTDDTGPVNANAPALDSAGLPWDERIHAATKTTKGDGTWTGRRGGPKGAELAAIEAELRARVGAAPQPVPTPAVTPQPMPVAAPIPMPSPAPVAMDNGAGAVAAVSSPVPQPMPMPAPTPMAAPVPQPMPMPAPVAAPVAAPLAAVAEAANQAIGTLDFAQFMTHISGQMTKMDGNGVPLIHADYLAQITAEIAGAFGVTLGAITDIATDPNKINFAVQAITRDGRW